MRRFFIAWLLSLAATAATAAAYDEFFRAVNVDDVGTVNALLQRGFDPNAPDEHGQVALYLAMREGCFKVAQALLSQPDIRVDAPNAVGETPLMMAALRGHLEWAQRLLQRGAALDREGWTPLHYAASGPSPKLVALLLDRGAKVDARSQNGSTPLIMAARYGPEESVDLLIARGADVRLRNDKGQNAADFARLGGRESLAARLDKLLR
jgi:ankyrin repeat protein